MKTIRIKVYQFSELSSDAKDVAVNRFYDINVNCDWWQYTYEDAANIGLKITAFDLDRANYCKGEFLLTANEVAANILKEHGESCETYNTAASFMEAWQPVFNEYLNPESKEYESLDSENKLNELEEDFLKSLCEDYKIILSKEYEHLTSEAAIIETIEANEYEFTKDGKKFNN